MSEEAETMLGDHGHGHLTMLKATLIEKLVSNGKQHRDEYRAAMRGFVEQLRPKLSALIEAMGDGVDIAAQLDAVKRLPVPESHVAEYERAINLVEFSVSDKIQLGEGRFRELVLDEWGWTERFKQVSSHYTSRR